MLLGEERHEHVIATLVKYMAYHKDSRYFESVLPYLKHPDNRVRANAIEGLEVAGDRRAAPHLTPLLNDPDNRVRANAAKYLMSSHPDDVVNTIEEMLASEHEWMRDSALFLINVAKPPKTRTYLADLLKDPEHTIRAKAAEYMGRLGTGSTDIEALGPLLADSHDLVREAAKKAVAQLEPREKGV